jgi:hypothetical protein
MAKYSTIHHHATLIGDMFGGNEIWTTGFALAQSNGGDEGDAPTDAEAQAIADAFAAIWTPTANGFSNNFRLLGCKVSHVSTDGTSDPSLTRYYYRPTPAVGGYATNANPAQITIAATLQTVKARGRGSKGRMYLPGVGFPVGGDGKLTTAQSTTLANQMKIFLDGVNASPVIPGFVHVMSAEVPGVPYKAPEQNRVSAVRVGNVYDTQRRRRNKLVEQYINANLA